MRAIALMLCLALAGCGGMSAVTDDSPVQVAPVSAPASAPGAAETPAAPPSSAPAAPQRRTPQALRGTSAPPAPPPSAEPALSTEQQVLAIRQGCWSAADRNRALKGLEARADWVSKCIADKTKEVGQ
jgi:cell division septation protein DedD